MKKAQTLRIAAVEPQGRDAILLSLGAEDGGPPNLPFAPGQYLTLGPEIDGDPVWRCYSITSEPGAEGPISVLVRRVAGGQASNWLCDRAQAGDALKVLPPAGRFRLARPGEPALLFAGGSGIAPVYALARQALEEGAARVALFYANRDASTAMLMAELEALQAAFGERLEVRHWYDGVEGFPAEADLGAFAKGRETADVYLCGPEPFMKLVRLSLAASGFADDRVHFEDFGAAVEEAVEDGAPESLLVVRLKGQTHEAPVKAGQSLLSAMLGAGLPAPNSCRVGECASCMCRLVSGEIERLDNSVLDEDDVADGWILACRTHAAGEKVEIRF